FQFLDRSRQPVPFLDEGEEHVGGVYGSLPEAVFQGRPAARVHMLPQPLRHLSHCLGGDGDGRAPLRMASAIFLPCALSRANGCPTFSNASATFAARFLSAIMACAMLSIRPSIAWGERWPKELPACSHCA